MPEQAYTPPETRYEVHIAELLKAIRGEPFEQGKGIYKKNNEEALTFLVTSGYSSTQLARGTEYFLIYDAKITGLESMRFSYFPVKIKSFSLIFVKCIVPLIQVEAIEIDGIYLFNSICDRISISKNGYVKAIALNNGSICSYIGIESSKCESLKLYSKSLCSGLYVLSNVDKIEIIVRGCLNIGDIKLMNANVSLLSISNCYFNFNISNTVIDTATISACILKRFILNGNNKGAFFFDEQSQIAWFRLANLVLSKDISFSFNNVRILYCIIENVLQQGNLIFTKLSPDFTQDNLCTLLDNSNNERNEGWERSLWNRKKDILEVEKKYFNKLLAELIESHGASPLFRISHSSLGKTEITGSKLAGFRFEYYNSKLLDCFITGTELPKDNIDIYNPNPKPDEPLSKHEIYTQKTAVYNQFKKIYENQGDVVEASEFHAQAMRWQQKLLWYNLRHGANGFWKKVKLFFEYFGFWLNWVSNNHGESWGRALLFTLAVSIVFFIASLWGLTHFWDWKIWQENLHKLPGFMLPTHSIDYLSKDIPMKPNLWHTTWDFLGRIFIGYGFFQFIAAFRRHGKKGG